MDFLLTYLSIYIRLIQYIKYVRIKSLCPSMYIMEFVQIQLMEKDRLKILKRIVENYMFIYIYFRLHLSNKMLFTLSIPFLVLLMENSRVFQLVYVYVHFQKSTEDCFLPPIPFLVYMLIHLERLLS